MTLGERIKQLRKAKGWSQITLAEKSDLNRNSIYSYESNKAMPRMPQLRRIAEALDVPLGNLVGQPAVEGIYSPDQLWASPEGERRFEEACSILEVVGFVVEPLVNERYKLIHDDFDVPHYVTGPQLIGTVAKILDDANMRKEEYIKKRLLFEFQPDDADAAEEAESKFYEE